MAIIQKAVNVGVEIREDEIEVVRPAGDGTPEAPGEVTAEFTEDAAVRLVVGDARDADAWLAKQWAVGWRENDILYLSPRSVSAYEGTRVSRANVNRFVVATHVNSVVPQMTGAIFYDDPPFELTAAPGTKQETIRVKKAVIAALLRKMKFKQQAKRGMQNQALHGTGIWKRGITRKTVKKKKYVRRREPLVAQTPAGTTTVHTKRSDEWDVQEREIQTWEPWCVHVPHRYVLPDVHLESPDIQDAQSVIHREYLNYYQIEELRGNPDYTLPPEEELKSYWMPPAEKAEMPGTAEQLGDFSGGTVGLHHAERRYADAGKDPLAQPLEVLERSTNHDVKTVVNGKLLIRDSENRDGKNPFFSSNWWDVGGSFWGLGVGRTVGQDQRIDTGLTNACLDLLAYPLNPDYIAERGKFVPTAPMRQKLGGVTLVDGPPNEVIKLKEQPKVPPEIFAVLQLSKSEGEAASGANELMVQGSMPASGRTSLGRTATGASKMSAASSSRIQSPVDNFVEQVFVPLLYWLDEVSREEMPMEDIRAIAGQELEDASLFDADEFLNAEFQYAVKAGALLAARDRMAQSISLMIQIFDNPATISQLNEVNEEYVDIGEMIHEMHDTSGWGSFRSVVKKMTPEMKQRQAARMAAAGKMQQAMALQQLKGQQAADQLEQKQVGRATDVVLRKIVENSEEGALTGAVAG